MIKAVGLSTQIYEVMRLRITDGSFAPGVHLVISALAHEFRVSPTPVREALARLHAEGLVSFTSNIGFAVTQAPSSRDYEHWMQARLLLEVNAARIAGGLVQDSDVKALRRINDELASPRLKPDVTSVRRFSDLNARFHRRLIEITANPFLLKAYDQIWLGPQFSRTLYADGVDQAAIAAEHQRIIDAIAARDVEGACDALREHIVDSLARDRAKRGAE